MLLIYLSSLDYTLTKMVCKMGLGGGGGGGGGGGVYKMGYLVLPVLRVSTVFVVYPGP